MKNALITILVVAAVLFSITAITGSETNDHQPKYAMTYSR